VAKPDIKAVLWDFGGVILTSPFEAFARYERERGLPDGFIRMLNASNPDDNAWARLERSDVDVDGFAELFEAEAAAAGHALSGHDVLLLLAGDVRPEMKAALHRIKEAGYLQGMLTNNFVTPDSGESHGSARPEVQAIMDVFDMVLESSKAGVRKPDPRFYERACAELAIEPREAVFLDDLGVNLKPARAMGMTTIKVVDPEGALAELESVLRIPLRLNH
jgi:putative hydrolase of the HAD superfamily